MKSLVLALAVSGVLCAILRPAAGQPAESEVREFMMVTDTDGRTTLAWTLRDRDNGTVIPGGTFALTDGHGGVVVRLARGREYDDVERPVDEGWTLHLLVPGFEMASVALDPSTPASVELQRTAASATVDLPENPPGEEVSLRVRYTVRDGGGEYLLGEWVDHGRIRAETVIPVPSGVEVSASLDGNGSVAFYWPQSLHLAADDRVEIRRESLRTVKVSAGPLGEAAPWQCDLMPDVSTPLAWPPGKTDALLWYHMYLGYHGVSLGGEISIEGVPRIPLHAFASLQDGVGAYARLSPGSRLQLHPQAPRPTRWGKDVDLADVSPKDELFIGCLDLQTINWLRFGSRSMGVPFAGPARVPGERTGSSLIPADVYTLRSSRLGIGRVKCSDGVLGAVAWEPGAVDLSAGADCIADVSVWVWSGWPGTGEVSIESKGEPFRKLPAFSGVSRVAGIPAGTHLVVVEGSLRRGADGSRLEVKRRVPVVVGPDRAVRTIRIDD